MNAKVKHFSRFSLSLFSKFKDFYKKLKSKTLPKKISFKKIKFLEPFFSSWRSIASIFLILLFIAILYLIKAEEKKTGIAETAIHLNSLEKSEKSIIWSNKAELCQLYNGSCYFGESFPQYTEFDYFVFFINQGENSIENDAPFSNLKNIHGTILSLKRFDGKKIEKSKIIKQKNVPAELLPPQAEFTFTIIGDSQRWSQLHNKEHLRFHNILEKINEANPDFLLAMGDLTPDYDCITADDCKPYFEKWKADVEDYVPIIYPAFGNHDKDNKAGYFWSDVFALPKNGPEEIRQTAYFIDHKNSRFIFLDSETRHQQSEGTVQMNWLKSNLQENQKRNVFVISHAPNFPKPKQKQMDQWKILFENNVFAQFSGDTHVFCQRTLGASEIGLEGGKINHFIIGNSASMVHPLPPGCENSYQGLNFAIVNVKGSEMTLTTYKYHGELISQSKLSNENYFPSN